MQLNYKARLETGFHGKSVETMKHIGPGNRHVKLYTMKRSSGKVESVATMVGVEAGLSSGFYSISWAMGDPYQVLESEAIRATEKALLGQHERALAKLDAFVEKHTAKVEA